MAGRKRERYQTEPREYKYRLCWNWMMKTKSKKLLVIKEIMFLAASWVGWTESLVTLVLWYYVLC